MSSGSLINDKNASVTDGCSSMLTLYSVWVVSFLHQLSTLSVFQPLFLALWPLAGCSTLFSWIIDVTVKAEKVIMMGRERLWWPLNCRSLQPRQRPPPASSRQSIQGFLSPHTLPLREETEVNNNTSHLLTTAPCLLTGDHNTRTDDCFSSSFKKRYLLSCQTEMHLVAQLWSKPFYSLQLALIKPLIMCFSAGYNRVPDTSSLCRAFINYSARLLKELLSLQNRLIESWSASFYGDLSAECEKKSEAITQIIHHIITPFRPISLHILHEIAEPRSVKADFFSCSGKICVQSRSGETNPPTTNQPLSNFN